MKTSEALKRLHFTISKGNKPNNIDIEALKQIIRHQKKQAEETTKEHYLIVLMETKEEIAAYDLGFEFDAASYSELAVQSLEGGLDGYEVLTKNPKVESVNGMDCVKSEMRGNLGSVNVFYKLGVFEGKNAFYQVLTWTIEEQKDQFGPHMDKIINSFKEA